ncbi:Haloacetate dehalogenase H-1 [Variovorax sp. PBS-H4]|uniref:alpha/beta fold hydrolase n=1 Tax=Variovorax sp. PBS-H4 TaxID=434008 RepID=UPI0013183278|nr:alpha/beta hydrolase [Variovorax sp. PBS-H4]VTU28401.1 Haloacetate dehalogenase H-1 [Variovorax sp. PBS-H4]
MTTFIDVRGTRTAVEVEGSGPPLVMLHGAEGSRRQFAAIRPELSDRYTVITYDQRDCGETTAPEVAPTLAELADDARALLEALGHASAFVFGTSFGGRVAQALAVRHGSAVRRLVLASTWPSSVSLASANPEIVQALGRLRAGLPATAEQMAEIFFPADYLQAHPDARAYFKSAPARSARSDRRAAAVGDLPDLDLSRIAQPTLVMAGTADRLVPAELTLSLKDRVGGAVRTVLLPGVGHLSVAQAPKEVASHLREFLV